VRKLVGCFVLVVLTAGCGEADADAPRPDGPTHLRVRQTPSPFQQVSAGPVSTMIPDAWHPRLAGRSDDPRQGIVAGPRPSAWRPQHPPLEGLAAMWVDGAAVGVPSDYYYLAATGPALDAITGSELCRATEEFVVSDNVPAFARGEPDSPGDYIAHGQGTCTVGRRPARWAYFVAAPGFGPVRELGIPTSCLYVVVAVMPVSPRAPFLLNRLLSRTEFNGASVEDMIAAAAPD
jgi:hypothetical protein